MCNGGCYAFCRCKKVDKISKNITTIDNVAVTFLPTTEIKQTKAWSTETLGPGTATPPLVEVNEQSNYFVKLILLFSDLHRR